MKIVRPVFQTVGGMGQSVRDLARLQEVVRILAAHGFGALAFRLGIPGIGRADAPIEATPERVVAAAQALGPTFVKLGQVMSTRPDLLPDDWCRALESLQDDVGPVPFEEIEQTLTENLGPDWRSAVERFDEAPLATASIAQVHRARLSDGREVVLKIQRRGIAKKIRADLNILQVLARTLIAEFPEVRGFDPRGILLEFERSILSELDFKHEAENTRKFAKNHEGDPRLRIPFVVDELSGESVLCLEFLDGIPIRKAREAGFEMVGLGERFLGVAYDQLFVHGYFHSDMHPGNVLVLEGGVLGILDFGMVGRLTPEMRSYVLSIMVAAERGDHRTLARLFYDIAIKEKRVDWPAVERDTVEILERNLQAENMQEIEIGRLITDLTAAANRHGARVPLSYTMFFKALLTAEGLARTVLHEQNPIKAAQPYFQKMMAETFSQKTIEQELFYQGLTLTSLGKRLPMAVAQILDDLDGQRFRVVVRDEADPEALDAQDRQVNRLILGAFTVGLWISGTVALFATSLAPFGIPLISLAMWALGAVFAVWTLWLSWSNRGNRGKASDQ